MAYTTINKSTDYFNTKLYTGNGTTNTAITGVGFQPDLSIIKARDMTYDHNVMDAVRGSTKRVATNLSDAESTQAEMIKSFASDGFNLGDNGGVNQNTKTYVAWNWKANGAGSANTDGSINSTVSASATSGFSIVSYTGTGANATVGHGLGVAPAMIIVKNLQNTYEWIIGHKDLASGGTGFSANWYFNGFNTSAKNQNATASWNSASPTTSVFSLHSGATYMNASGQANIAYCFAEKTGYSKFGSYVGNGNADGTFVYTGFKPAFVMTKNSSAGSTNWSMMDNKRFGYNVTLPYVYANTSGVEQTDQNVNNIDILSNGFKCRESDANRNASGASYIYMAFAEAPLVGTNNVPCTAR